MQKDIDIQAQYNYRQAPTCGNCKFFELKHNTLGTCHKHGVNVFSGFVCNAHSFGSYYHLTMETGGNNGSY